MAESKWRETDNSNKVLGLPATKKIWLHAANESVVTLGLEPHTAPASVDAGHAGKYRVQWDAGGSYIYGKDKFFGSLSAARKFAKKLVKENPNGFKRSDFGLAEV